MPYAQNQLIQASDYNTFANSVNTNWGIGSGDQGYGQTSTTLGAVSQNATIAATNWADLVSRVTTMRAHQGFTVTTLTTPVANTLITFQSTLSGIITDCNTNRLTGSVGGNIVTGTTGNTNAAGFTGTRTMAIAYTWGSTNQMRYFFNGGGYVDFNAGNSSFSGNTKSNDWQTNIIGTGGNVVGNCRIKAQQAESNSGTNTNAGFYDLTSTNLEIHRRTSPTTTGGYNSNYCRYLARLNAANWTTATQLIMTIEWVDGSTDVFDDTVSGTAGFQSAGYAPVTTYLANVWGAVSGSLITNT